MKYILLIITILSAVSCGSGLYDMKRKMAQENRNIQVKSYPLKDFDIYTFTICEDAKKDVNNERFCACAANFYSIPKNENILKVEELYVLRHTTLNLVLYLTTTSHRYLKLKKGFLNDSTIYKDKIVLNEIEYAYIGTINEAKNIIHFPNQKGGQDVILHYNSQKYPQTINIEAANIATVENKFTTDNPIQLTDVFGDPVAFNRGSYRPTFYEGSIGKSTPFQPQCVNIISRNGKVAVVFGCTSVNNEKFYRIANSKIRYTTNFFLMP